jgi:N-acetyl-alpha-D-muramate 1-phosphate uridylyltransferase
MINYAIILAAGRGLRMMPLTQRKPKPMLDVNGESLISHAIQQVIRKIPNVAITVGYQGAMLAKHVIQQGVAAVFNTNGQGNAWWVFNTLMRSIDEPVLVLTCDNIMDLDLDFIEGHYNRLNMPACMLVPVIPVQGVEGDYIFDTDGLVENLSRTDKTPVYCSGIQVINPKQICQITGNKDDFYEVWQILIEQKKLYCSPAYPHPWLTVNTPEQLNFIKEKFK